VTFQHLVKTVISSGAPPIGSEFCFNKPPFLV